MSRRTRLAKVRAAWTSAVLSLWLAHGARAQLVQLEVAAPTPVALGDTVWVAVRAATEGHSLTSAGFALRYDAGALAPVPAAVLEDGTVQPFEADSDFFPGTVYENAVLSDGPRSGRLRFAVVTDPMAATGRPAVRGQGVLARSRFAVVGVSDTAAVIELIAGGRDRPAFTELGRPGVEEHFRVVESARRSLTLAATGFLPLSDIDIVAGRVAAFDLSHHVAPPPARWQVTSLDPDLVTARVDGDSLLLATGPRRQGRATLSYAAATMLGTILGSGTAQVSVAAGPALLADPGLVLPEDGGRAEVPLTSFLAQERQGELEVGAVAPLKAELSAASVVLSTAADWHGTGLLILRLRSGRDLLDTLAVSVVVTSVNDPPVLSLPQGSLVATVGARTMGPTIASLVADVDDARADLSVTVTGDAAVEAWFEDGRLLLLGQQAGDALLWLRATDPAGAAVAAALPVRVKAASAAPIFAAVAPLRLLSGQSLAVALADLVTDSDTPSSSLQVRAEAGGAVADAAREGDSLRVTAGAQGDGWVRLLVADEVGNQASTMWSAVVVAPPSPDLTQVPPSTAEPASAPGPPLTADSPAIEAPPVADEPPAIEEQTAIEESPSAVQPATGDPPPAAQPVAEPPGTVPSGQDEPAAAPIPDPSPDSPPAAIEPPPTAVEPPAAKVEERALSFASLPRVDLAAGATAELELADFVAPGGAARTFTVAGGTFVTLDLDADSGRLRLTAPPGAEGREVLLVTATDGTGHRATAVLDVLVWRSAENALRLLPLPPLALASGDLGRVDLAGHTVGADGAVTWSVTSSSDLVEAVVRGAVLTVRAHPSLAGQTVLLVWATDAAQQRASELLSVRVEGREVSGGDGALQVRPLADLTLAPGDSLRVDLDSLAGDVVGAGLSWAIADSGGLLLALDPAGLRVSVPEGTEPGRQAILEAADLTGAIVTLRVVVAASPLAAAPGLVLRAAQERVVAAGAIDESLYLDSLVAIGHADRVEWSVRGGGVRLKAEVSGSRRLRLDARQGLPGREVFALSAALDGEVQSLSVVVRVRLPRVSLQAPEQGVEAAGDTALDIDRWVEGEVEPEAIAWQALHGPEGVEVSWDPASRRLRLGGAGVGRLQLVGRLETGLQVASAEVALLMRAEAPAAPADAAPPWDLVVPTPAPESHDGEIRLRLGDLVTGADAASLDWKVSAIAADSAWIEAGSGVVAAVGTGILRLRLDASDASGATRRLDLVIPVGAGTPPVPPGGAPSAAMPPGPEPTPLAPPAAEPPGRAPSPPGVTLLVSLTWEEGVPLLRARVEADSGASVAVSVIGSATSTKEGAATVLHQVPLPAGGGLLRFEVEARQADRKARLETAIAAGLFGSEGGVLIAADGGLQVRVPAGGDRVAVLVAAVAPGVREYRLERLGGSGTLGLFFPDRTSGEGWTEVQELSAERWVPAPGSRRSHGEPGVTAFTAPDATIAAYRPAAVGAVAVAAVDPEPFPNPFNASVTLPLGPGRPGERAVVRIYDACGRPLRALGADLSSAAVAWDGLDENGDRVASGVYLYRVQTWGRPPRQGKVTVLR